MDNSLILALIGSVASLLVAAMQFMCTACGCVVGPESMELINRFNKLEQRMDRAGFPKAD